MKHRMKYCFVAIRLVSIDNFAQSKLKTDSYRSSNKMAVLDKAIVMITKQQHFTSTKKNIITTLLNYCMSV